MRWNRWNWLDDGLLPLLLATLRFCWLWLCLDLVRAILTPSHSGALLSPGLLIGLPLVSLTLARTVANRAPVPEQTRKAQADEIGTTARITVAVVGLVVIVAALWWQFYRTEYTLLNFDWVKALGQALIRWDGDELPAPWPVLFALIYLWLRGMLDATQPATHDDIWGAFVTGLIMLGLYLIITATNNMPLATGAINLILLFFGAGMAALAFSTLKITAGLDRALGLGQRRLSQTPALSRYWLISIATTVLLLLGLGVGLALLVAPEQVAVLVALLSSVLSTIGSWIGSVLAIIGYVLFVIAYYVALLLRPLVQWLMSLLAGEQEPQPFNAPEPPPPAELEPIATAVIPDSYRWIALGLLTLAVLVIFAVVLRRMRRTQTEDGDEVRESILTTDLLQDQLAKLWQSLFGGLGNRLATIGPYLSLEGEMDTRRIIRAAYQALLATTTAQGQTRARSQTPQEYQHQLANAMPPASDPLTRLTERYNQARYAAEPPSQQAAEEGQQAWAAVQAMLEPKEPEAGEAQTVDGKQ